MFLFLIRRREIKTNSDGNENSEIKIIMNDTFFEGFYEKIHFEK